MSIAFGVTGSHSTLHLLRRGFESGHQEPLDFLPSASFSRPRLEVQPPEILCLPVRGRRLRTGVRTMFPSREQKLLLGIQISERTLGEGSLEGVVDELLGRFECLRELDVPLAKPVKFIYRDTECS